MNAIIVLTFCLAASGSNCLDVKFDAAEIGGVDDAAECERVGRGLASDFISHHPIYRLTRMTCETETKPEERDG